MTTVAGDGASAFSGGDNGPATGSQMGSPHGVAVDASGALHIADEGSGRIRKVSNGVITTVAGIGISGGVFGPSNPDFLGDGGPAASASLSPQGVTIDTSGNLYIADTGNNRIRKVSNGVITTVAGGGRGEFADNVPAAGALTPRPSAVAVDASGSVYITNPFEHRIRKISNGVITTVAGNGAGGFSGDNGPATNASLNVPFGVAVDTSGNLYIADTGNQRIRKVSNGVIATVAGNGAQGFSGDSGPATSASLDNPFGVAFDTTGNVYVADWGNNRIRRISNGAITTVAGNGDLGFGGDNGPATNASLFNPTGVAVDGRGNVYIADPHNARVRILVPSGPSCSAASVNPASFSLSPSGADLSVTIQATASCPWAVGGLPPWITIPAVSGAGSGTIALTVEQNSGAPRTAILSIAGTAVPVTQLGGAPAVNRNGIVPIYSAVPTIQPGSWISIFGSGLSAGTSVWNGDFPTSLGGVSVTINGKPGSLWFVSPLQITLQAPDDTATGSVNVVVTTPIGSTASTVTLAPYAPSFSLWDSQYAAAVIATPGGGGAYGDGSYDLAGPAGRFSFNTRPVQAGEVLVLYGVGFGPTDPPVVSGRAFSGAAPTTSLVTITIGGVAANVLFSGITSAGLYQLNVVVPNGAGSGDRLLQATVGGARTPDNVYVSVK